MNEDLYEKLLNASFRFVSYRPRSQKEIRDFLQKKLKAWKIAGQATIRKVMARLGEYGYVNDEAFARFWIDQRKSFRPKGMRLLVAELRQKGVGKEVAERALAAKSADLEPYNELEAARCALVKKLALWGNLLPLERKKRIFGFLGRRGFSASTIHRVIDESVGKSYNTDEETEGI